MMSVSLSFSTACLTLFFSSPSFSFLCSLSSSASSLPSLPPTFPPSSSPAYISHAVCSDSGDLRTHHSPHSTGTPPFCLSPCFVGSHDSCTLDRGRIIAREIKAEDDNAHAAHTHSRSPSLCVSLPHALLPDSQT